jgi:diphthamide biosynthesis enzyme Dph1/Dph2-like protein
VLVSWRYRTQRLPVRYCFGRATLDASKLVQGIKDALGADANVLLFYRLEYAHAMAQVKQAAEAADGLPHLVVPTVPLSNEPDEKLPIDSETQTHHTIAGYQFDIDANVDFNSYKIVFVGSESVTLSNIAMNYNQCEVDIRCVASID